MCNMTVFTNKEKYSEKVLSNLNKSAIIQTQKQKRKITKRKNLKKKNTGQVS